MLAVLDWLERVAQSSTTVLVASDFDGTLAPIVARAEVAQLGPRARAVLRRLSDSPRARVAIISGRALLDIVSRVDEVRPAWIAAEHGSVLRDCKGRIHSADPVPSERVALLHLYARDIAQVFPGARVEEKERGVALHFREVAAEKHEMLIEMFRLASAGQRAHVISGRAVIEGRFSKANKAAALTHILGQMPEDVAFLYGGDDATDESPLELAAASRNGLAVYVRSDERPNPTVNVNAIVNGPEHWIAILGEIARILAPMAADAS